MKAVLATGVMGAVAIALFSEVIDVVLTFSVLRHAASYNSWMAM